MSSKFVPFTLAKCLPNSNGACGTIELCNDVHIAWADQRTQEHPKDHCVGTAREISMPSLCLLDVPAHMIPKEILRFFGSNLAQISSIRIVKHTTQSDKYLAIIDVISVEAANQFVCDFSGQVLSSLEDVRCTLVPIAKIVIDQHDNFEPTSRASSAASLNTEDDGEMAGHCPVCLECFSEALPMSITTFCNHRFHMQCMLKLESSQCPVCRFQHDSMEASDTECFVCGLRSGEHGLGTAHPSDLWLCLICGFTGCGARHGGHIQRHYELSLHTYAQNTETRQVWDFAGDGYVHRLVLNSTANTADLLSGEDINNMLSNASTKMVEVSAPQSLLETRDPRAPLSSEQEQHVVSAKLEAAAKHYNQLLAWQLEQNRLLYETRLQRIRDSAGNSNTTASDQAGSQVPAPISGIKSSVKTDKGVGKGPNKYFGPTWRENMIASLRNERMKLLKQVEGAKERLTRAHREVEVLQELNASLTINQTEWQKRVDIAAKCLANAEATYRREIPQLEEKVRLLMEKLDMVPKSNTGSKQATDDALPSAACDESGDEAGKSTGTDR